MAARTLIVLATVAACLGATAAEARTRHARDGNGGGGVPELNVKGSCTDAQKFSTGSGDNQAYKGCMQDEANARTELAKRWSSFKPRDRTDCVEQGREPSPSYVEVLTCLEMDSDAMKNAPRIDGRPVPQIGGPVAPGLTNTPVPKT